MKLDINVTVSEPESECFSYDSLATATPSFSFSTTAAIGVLKDMEITPAFLDMKSSWLLS